MPHIESLSSSRSRLVRTCQELNFGRIVNLKVERGEPVFGSGTAVIREVKFGADNTPRREAELSNFKLRDVVRELLDHLDQIGDGVIDELVIKHGLPFSMTVRSTR
ncbi:MAG: hypothetical protein K2W85_06845 [Phycisphaerales bacterium]|nr:hypothetical protein [Phycisphaerales bacterium]